jgi:uncharacterized protein (DUF1684 family)
MKAFFLHSRLFILALLANVNSLVAQSNYKQEIDSWHVKRMESLKSKNGWLNLAGLFWLKEGLNSVGTQQDNDIVFPPNAASSHLCKLILNHNVVSLLSSDLDSIFSNGTLLKGSHVVFNESENIEVELQHKHLFFFIIKRGNKYAVRLRNLDSENVKTFKGVERFDVDEKWKLKARVEQPQPNQTVDVIDVLGNTTTTAIGAILHFNMNGKEYSLIGTKEEQKLFVVFADNTAGITTYGSGRFIYVDFPENSKEVIIDFNKAYNPPCAFTSFATCPLPLKQNFLNLDITAGEKNYGNH